MPNHNLASTHTNSFADVRPGCCRVELFFFLSEKPLSCSQNGAYMPRLCEFGRTDINDLVASHVRTRIGQASLVKIPHNTDHKLQSPLMCLSHACDAKVGDMLPGTTEAVEQHHTERLWTKAVA